MSQNVKFTVEYSVPVEIMFKTLTDQMALCQMTQGAAVSEPMAGGKYKLYDGMITGVYVDVVENQKIAMKWRMKDWASKDGMAQDSLDLDPNDADNCFCDLVLSFDKDASSDCTITVDLKKVPEYDRYQKYVHASTLEGGWRQMIFERINQVFGYPIKK